MKNIILNFFLITCSLIYGQQSNEDLKIAKKELASLNLKIDSLNSLKNILKKRIDSIELSQFDSDNEYILRWDWKIIKAGEKCKVISPGEKWTIISTLKFKNYKVSSYYLVKQEKYIELQNEASKEKNIEIAERKLRLTQRYGSKIAEKILKKDIWIGMTRKMTVESWGEPDDINKTVGTWGVHEQWIYYKQGFYLYFENDKLTSWQD